MRLHPIEDTVKTAEDVRLAAKRILSRRAPPPPLPRPRPDLFWQTAKRFCVPMPRHFSGSITKRLPRRAVDSEVAEFIIDRVSVHFGVAVSDMAAWRRLKTVVRARHAAWWLMSVLTGMSYPQIGRAFGPERHHSTVLVALRKMRRIGVTTDLLALRDEIEQELSRS
jgi:hypothetical protein